MNTNNKFLLICAGLISASAGNLRGSSFTAPSSFCSDTGCWPDIHTWQQLNTTVGGKLEGDLASPIYACISPPDQQGQCSEQWANVHSSPFWAQVWGAGGSNSVGYNKGWNAVPTKFAVVCHSAEDIQAAIKFAVEHNIRPVIKGAGHDYLGRSSGPEDGFALTIYTFWMKDMSFDDEMNPELMTVGAGVIWEDAYRFALDHGRMVIGGGCPSVGAAGGWAMGGGMSDVLGKMVGHGVDNMMSAKVVLANGTLVTASKEENPRLYWALRGGGGGTFGVLTELTWKTHDAEPWKKHNSMMLEFNAKCTSADDFATFMKSLWSWYGSVSQRNYGGTVKVSKDDDGSISISGDPITSFNMTQQEHTKQYTKLTDWIISDANPCQQNVEYTLMNDTLLDSRPNGARAAYPSEWIALTQDIPSYSNTSALEQQFGKEGTDFLLSKWYGTTNQDEVFTFWSAYNSRFVNASEFADPETLAAKFKQLAMTPGAETFTISLGKAEAVWEDGQVKTIGATVDEVSTHPAIRDSGLFLNGFMRSGMTDYSPMIPVDETQDLAFLKDYLHRAATKESACPAAGQQHAAAATAKCSTEALVDLAAAKACNEVIQQCFDALHELEFVVMDKLADLWPGMGAYPNEASYFQKDWRTEFWGGNYAKLEKIKKEVDPANLFQCHHCVGSEE